MKQITIDEKMQSKLNLPAKSLGIWKVSETSADTITLHRINKDGTLGSDRPNNIYKLHAEIFDEISPQEKKAESAKPTPTAELPVLGVRKSRWIDRLISEIESDPFLQGVLEAKGAGAVRLQIFEDTKPERVGGKAYSSISTGMKVWMGRLRKEA